MMIFVILTILVVILFILYCVLNVSSHPQQPAISCADKDFLDVILKTAPLLEKPYMPTQLWGFNGHLQTIIRGVIETVRCPWPQGQRIYITLHDGATLAYDLYEPLNGLIEDDVTLVLYPGFGNTTENAYIRTCVTYAQNNGFRCAVLNQLGLLNDVPLTSPRIFSYGNTNDYHDMILDVLHKYSNTKIICIGFSLGGNLITKYLGELERNRPSQIIGGISVCQPYSTANLFICSFQWSNFRWTYLYLMAWIKKRIIFKNKSILLSHDIKSQYQINEKEIRSAVSLHKIDEEYTRRVHKFNSRSDLYDWSSSINYICNIRDPMIHINSTDDPIVAKSFLEPIRSFAEKNSNAIYLELAHGGHLAFVEGGFLYPNTFTWQDRAVTALVKGLLVYHKTSSSSRRRNNIDTNKRNINLKI